MAEQGREDRTGFARRPPSILGWLGLSIPLGLLLAAGAALGLLVALLVVVGGVNVAADRPDGWAVRHFLHFVFKRSEAGRSSSDVPPDDLAAASRVRLGAQHFDMVCANCHGRPGFGQSVTALSMNPRPQYLPRVVGQFTDKELYRIVEHGVKYSAMPSWPTGARGDEVWSMVAFLRQLPRLDAKAYLEMTALPQKADAAPTAFGADAATRPANAMRNTPPVNEFSYAAPAAGFADASIRDNPATTCARCHGADGSGAATGGEAPNLTVHDAAYIEAALDSYTRGSRRSGFMQTVAAELSDAQIGALAHYYAGLPVRTVSTPAADPALVRRGEAIAASGLRERAIPACASCHESAGAQINGAPHIAGQSALYLRRQLAVMARGGRGASLWWNPMPAVAHDLSRSEIAAVAAYYAALPAGKAAGGGQPSQAAQGAPPATPVGNDLGGAKQIFATTCVKCHVHGGHGDLEGDYPDLTLQARPYVAQSLYAFRAGTRPSVKMREVTGALSLDRMASLADYVDSLEPRPASARIDAGAARRGAIIALRGAPARGVPACLGCHGAKGVAALPLIPRLQGQNVLYLHRRLDNFAAPQSRYLSRLNPMPQIAGQLTDQERADLAAYFAAAAPLGKSAAAR